MAFAGNDHAVLKVIWEETKIPVVISVTAVLEGGRQPKKCPVIIISTALAELD